MKRTFTSDRFLLVKSLVGYSGAKQVNSCSETLKGSISFNETWWLHFYQAFYLPHIVSYAFFVTAAQAVCLCAQEFYLHQTKAVWSLFVTLVLETASHSRDGLVFGVQPEVCFNFSSLLFKVNKLWTEINSTLIKYLTEI